MDKILANSLGYLVSRASRAMANGLAKRFAASDCDVTVEQWRVMVNLWLCDGQTQKELSQATDKGKTSITRLIHGMEKRNLVVRVPDQNDGRLKRIYLTHKGRELQDELIVLAAQNQDQAQTGIDKEQLEICMDVLRRVIENLR